MTAALNGLRKILAPAVLLAASWFVLDHLLPDLLPKPPHTVGWLIAGLAAAVAAAALAARGWAWLNARVPQPWFPRPFWRVGLWLRHRASVSIVAAFPKVAFGNGTMDACDVSLTLQRNLARLESSSTMEFDQARLVLSQRIGRRTRRFVFTPRDTGGFLALPNAARTSDVVMVEFVGTRFPTPLGEAPDFSRDYQLTLSGVRIRVHGWRPFAAELAAAVWPWFHQFNSGLATAFSLPGPTAAV